MKKIKYIYKHTERRRNCLSRGDAEEAPRTYNTYTVCARARWIDSWCIYAWGIGRGVYYNNICVVVYKAYIIIIIIGVVEDMCACIYTAQICTQVPMCYVCILYIQCLILTRWTCVCIIKTHPRLVGGGLSVEKKLLAYIRHILNTSIY